MRSIWQKSKSLNLPSESGISLVELIVTIFLLSIAITGLTSMMIMSMRTEDKITSGFRSQLDTRQVVYDMEVQISEVKRVDSLNQKAIFQANAVSMPTQQGNWVTYEYATPVGESSPTLIRRYSPSRPNGLPVSPASTDHKLIDVGQGEQSATVEPVSDITPIFSFYGEDGTLIPAPVSNPTTVRSIKVAFLVTNSAGHTERESNIASTQITLRNY